MKQRLYRKRTDKVVAGVAAGMGEYFDLDPVFIRLAFVLLAFIHGIGILAYIVLWILVPARDAYTFTPMPDQTSGGVPGQEASANSFQGGKAAKALGVIFIVLGGLFLADNFVEWLDIGDLWPILLIVFGVVMLLGARKEATGSGQEVAS